HRAPGALLPARPRRLGRRRRGPAWDRIPLAQPRPAAPQPGNVRSDPVPELPNLPRREFPSPPLSGPVSGPQPRRNPHDRRGGKHLRGDGCLLDGATREHVYPSEEVIAKKAPARREETVVRGASECTKVIGCSAF